MKIRGTALITLLREGFTGFLAEVQDFLTEVSVDGGSSISPFHWSCAEQAGVEW